MPEHSQVGKGNQTCGYDPFISEFPSLFCFYFLSLTLTIEQAPSCGAC
jgi:hypothetical protein